MTTRVAGRAKGSDRPCVGSLRERRAGCACLLAAILLLPQFASCARKGSAGAGARGDVAPVLVAQATREDVPVTLRTIGTVEAYRSAAVRARVGGTLTRVHFREGQEVQAGAPLFSLDARPYAVALQAAAANLAGARAKAAIAAGNAERSLSLLDQNLVSRQEHERVISTAQAESAAVRSLEAGVESARLNLEYCTITAPISGRTSNLLVSEGNLVRANDDQALVVINQLAPIFVAFSAPQRSLPELRRYMAEGPPLAVEASVAGATREAARGRLTFVNNALDPSTGSILLKAEFPNQDLGLWPGEFVHVSVILTTRQGALVVPEAAVQSGQKGPYVLVVKSDQTAEMRPVVVGPRLEGRAIIEGGLEPGETVVTDGHLRVVPGAKVAIKTGLEAPRGHREMNVPELCIRRPVMTTLVMLGILIFGIVGYRLLPVSNLPNVDFPTVSVSASLPGASPETMASTVATPLEKEFSTIAGISSMSSSSALGSTNITLQFDLSRNIDAAAQDVQAAIAATHHLPKEMPSPPSYSKVNPADQPIFFIALTSPTLPLSALDEYGETLLAQRISMVNGVAQVNVYGGQKYAVRIQLDPSALAATGIGFDDVTAAIQRENVKLPTGTLYGPDQTFTIEASGQLDEAAAFRSLIVAYRNGKPVRLEELGNVLDSVENTRTAAWYGDERSIFLVIQRQPGTNIVAVADAVRALLPAFRAKLPASVSMNILYDRSESIRASVRDVKFTLFLTLCLVVLIIFLFLRNLSATVIPSLALPMSIIGTFAVMYVFGYSLDNLSLMALTLSLGFVVDDAIVMLENIVRHMEKGEGVMEAALKGSREIGFTIISMTISLATVFIPVLFMGGIIGRLFQEFAVTIMAAILISGMVSLSLTPVLCSRFLRPGKATHAAGDRTNRFYLATERGFLAAQAVYGRGLRWSVRHRRAVLVFSILVLAATVALFRIVPTGFIPSEDVGQISVNTEAREGISYEQMVLHQKAVAGIVSRDANVDKIMTRVGGGGRGGSNTGSITVRLKPRKARQLSADQLIAAMRPRLAQVPGIRAFLQNPPPINVGGRQSRSQYQITMQGTDTEELYRLAPVFLEKLRTLPGLIDLSTDLMIRNPKVDVAVDREQATTLGVSTEQIQQTLYNAYGSRQISSIYTPTNEYQVILELKPEFQVDAASMGALYVRSESGTLVPLNAVATVTPALGPLTVNHSGQIPSVTISFNLNPGVSLGQAVVEVDKLARAELPPTITTNFQGTAQAFQSSMKGLGMLLVVAVLVIYLVLGILYESFIHPLTILSALPFAGFGALVTLLVFGVDLNIYSFVGVIMLVGLVKKNGIMMVDFALEAQRTERRTPVEAIIEACLIRFRPIMMTTMAALMGTLPIAIGFGAGSESRRPLGLAVVGGLLFSQFFTLFVTPVFYLYMDRVQAWLGGRAGWRGLTRTSQGLG